MGVHFWFPEAGKRSKKVPGRANALSPEETGAPEPVAMTARSTQLTECDDKAKAKVLYFLIKANTNFEGTKQRSEGSR